MGERCTEGRIGAIDLGKGRGMKLLETIDKLAQLHCCLFVGGVIIERGPPHEFRRRNLARLGGLVLDPRLILRRNRDDQSLRRQAHCRLLTMDIVIYMIMSPTARARRDRHQSSRHYVRQFFSLSTSLLAPIHGIMVRSLAPTSSIGCAAALARIALNEVWLT